MGNSSQKSPSPSPSPPSASSTPSPTPPRSTFASTTASTYGSSATTQPHQKALSSDTSQPHGKLATPRLASQNVKNSVNNYVIPAAETAATREEESIRPCQGESPAQLNVCPQYNGRGCVAFPCRRLHTCYYWATKTCNRNTCKKDHCLDSPHNQQLLNASVGKNGTSNIKLSRVVRIEELPSLRQNGPQICLYNVLKRCKKDPCTKVHCAKSYLWEVQDGSKWLPLSYSQSDYLELMYSHPSKESVSLISLNTLLPNKNLKRLVHLLSKETSWTVDLEAMKLRGGSLVLDVRRLCTPSDLSSSVPVATRWLWYWQGDNAYWEPYKEGVINGYYYVALSDCIEFFLRMRQKKIIKVTIGQFAYTLDGEKMTQTNLSTGRIRSMRRRPACSTVNWESVKFTELFLPLPASQRYLKLPLLPLSSEFIFVESLLKQTLPQAKVASIHRVQNDHLWRAYQTKKRLLTSLYAGDETATNEQYLFHGTTLSVIDLICEENLDWKLSGTNVGRLHGSGTYFSNLASLAHQYAGMDSSGKRVMLVVLVMVGKMTRGSNGMILPPMNADSGRTYDTTCNSDTNATIFVKYNRDEYYPAYVVIYSSHSF